MITGVRQTPLSHVNLRAIQDRVPNAYVAGADKNKILLDCDTATEFIQASLIGRSEFNVEFPAGLGVILEHIRGADVLEEIIVVDCADDQLIAIKMNTSPEKRPAYW